MVIKAVIDLFFRTVGRREFMPKKMSKIRLVIVSERTDRRTYIPQTFFKWWSR